MTQKRLGLRGLLTAAAVLGFAASFIAWLHPWLPWWAELPMHLTLIHALALAVVGAGLALFRAWRWAVACTVLAILHLIPPLGWLAGTAPTGPAQLRVLVANVLTSNGQRERLLRLIEREQPDVIALVEVDDAWLAALAPLSATYPHQISETRDDNFGVALFSRRPLDESAIIHPGAFELPVIDVRLGGACPARLVLAHPPPPISGEYAAVRNAMLMELAGRAARDPRTVLVGDLNCTPWAAPFRRLLRDGGLSDSRAGIGSHASWPTPLGAFGIPIDHALVGPAVAVSERRLGESIGSDHRPLVIGVRMR